MVSAEQLATRILEELARLGCREISLDVETGSSEGLIRHGEEEVRLGLERTRAALFVLPSYSGDDVVWAALQEAAGGRAERALAVPGPALT